MMEWWKFALWGFLGGLLTDGIEFWKNVKMNEGRLPTLYSQKPFYVAESIRLIGGAILAVGFSAANQISGVFGALFVGIATPLICEKLSKGYVLSTPIENGQNQKSSTKIGFNL